MKTEYIGFHVPQQDKEALARFAQDNAICAQYKSNSYYNKLLISYKQLMIFQM